MRRRHDLAVTKTDDADPVAVGADVTYAVTVRNVGADPATGVVATDTLPAGMSFVSGAGCTAVGQTVTCAHRHARARRPGDPDDRRAGRHAAAEDEHSRRRAPTRRTTSRTTTRRPRRPASAIAPLELARAMIEDESWVTGASFVTMPPNGNPNMVGRSPLAGFPRHGDTFALLTSGDAELAADADTSSSSGSDDGGPNVRGNTDFDVTILKVDLDRARGRELPLGSTSASVRRNTPSTRARRTTTRSSPSSTARTWTTTARRSPRQTTSPSTRPASRSRSTPRLHEHDRPNAAGTTTTARRALLQRLDTDHAGRALGVPLDLRPGRPDLDSAVFLDGSASAASPPAPAPRVRRYSPPRRRPTRPQRGGGSNGYTITIANPHTESFEIDALVDDLPDGFAYTPGSTTGATTADPTITGQRVPLGRPVHAPGRRDADAPLRRHRRG